MSDAAGGWIQEQVGVIWTDSKVHVSAIITFSVSLGTLCFFIPFLYVEVFVSKNDVNYLAEQKRRQLLRQRKGALQLHFTAPLELDRKVGFYCQMEKITFS